MNDKICFYMQPFPRVKSYYDMIDISAEYNLSSLEAFCMLDFETPDIEAAKKIRKYADSKNINFSCFSVYINLVGPDSEEMIKKLKGYAEVAAILGSPYLHHTIANDFSEPNNVVPYREEFFKKGVEAVREIYDYAEKLGVRAIYEEQGFLFNGISGIGRLIDAVDRNVGVVADFGNIEQSGDDLIEFIKTYSDRIVHAHIKDVTVTDSPINRGSLKTLTGKYMTEAEIGKGDVKIKEAIELLKSIGYDGYYGIEYAASDDNSPVIDESLTFVDSLLS